MFISGKTEKPYGNNGLGTTDYFCADENNYFENPVFVSRYKNKCLRFTAYFCCYKNHYFEDVDFPKPYRNNGLGMTD